MYMYLFIERYERGRQSESQRERERERERPFTYVLNRYINVFQWRKHKNMNTVFRLINPAYDMDTYIFKLNVFTKQAAQRWAASRRRRLRLLSVVVPFLALCSCARFAGVGGVFSVGVSCVRVTCLLFYKTG